MRFDKRKLLFNTILRICDVTHITFVKTRKRGTVKIKDVLISPKKCLTGEIVIDENEKITYCTSIENSKLMNSKTTYKKTLIVYVNKPFKFDAQIFNFKYARTLVEVQFNGLVDFSNQTKLNEFFLECFALKTVDFGNTSFKSLEEMNSMFAYCTSLENIMGFDFNLPAVKEMNESFHHCFSLNKLDFSNANLKNVTTTVSTFKDCNTLKEIDMSNLELNKLESARKMFYGCINLKLVEIKEIKQIKNAKYMFCNCLKLEHIEIGFDFKHLECAASMFKYCKKLQHFDFKKFNPEHITEMSHMFNECESLEEEAVFQEFIYDGKELLSLFSRCKKITKIDMKKVTMNRIQKLNEFAYNCTSLKSIEMGTSYSNYINMEYFAANCYQLKYISLKRMLIDSGGGAYQFANNCEELRVVDLGFCLGKLKECNYMFSNCKNLTILKQIEEENGIFIEQCAQMFYNCNKLASINLKNFKLIEEVIDKNRADNMFPEKIKLIYTREELKNVQKQLLIKNKNTLITV